MRSLNSLELKTRHSPLRAGGHGSVRALALCLVTMAAVALTTSIVVAATDPDWIGTAPRNISQSKMDKALNPAVAAGTSGQIAIAWNDIPSGESKPDIFVARSYDQGRSWGSPTRVSATAAKSRLPDAIVLGNKIMLDWTAN